MEDICLQGFGVVNLRERDHLKGLNVVGRMILKLYIQEVIWSWGGGGRADLIWLRIAAGGGVLKTQ